MSSRQQFTETTTFGNKKDSHSPAFGQVLVISFETSLTEINKRDDKSLDNEDTLVIIKPHFHTPYFKFPGGMLKEPGAFEIAVVDELREETGVIADPAQLVLFHTTQKQQFWPHLGTFDLRLYMAFGCQFESMFSPEYGEVGDEGEVVKRVRLGDICSTITWPIPTNPSVNAGFFPPYLELLEEAKQEQAG